MHFPKQTDNEIEMSNGRSTQLASLQSQNWGAVHNTQLTARADSPKSCCQPKIQGVSMEWDGLPHIGSGPFMTGVSGTSGSYFMPVPIGFHVTSKLGSGLQVSCVQISLVSMATLQTRLALLNNIETPYNYTNYVYWYCFRMWCTGAASPRDLRLKENSIGWRGPDAARGDGMRVSGPLVSTTIHDIRTDPY